MYTQKKTSIHMSTICNTILKDDHDLSRQRYQNVIRFLRSFAMKRNRRKQIKLQVLGLNELMSIGIHVTLDLSFE